MTQTTCNNELISLLMCELHASGILHLESLFSISNHKPLRNVAISRVKYVITFYISSSLVQVWNYYQLNAPERFRLKSTLAQIMDWCHQATSHYLSQCWPSSMPPYGVTILRWLNPCWTESISEKKILLEVSQHWDEIGIQYCWWPGDTRTWKGICSHAIT